MSTNYDRKKAQLCATYCEHSKDDSNSEAIRHAPLVSLAVQCHIDENRTLALKTSVIPQYGLLGFDLGNSGNDDNAEPIFLNTNAPSSVFFCGSQGSGKSYTLSCILENHLLKDVKVGIQREIIPGFVLHYDSNGTGYLAEAASLCSRGIKVRVLVSWSNYQKMKERYEKLAAQSGNSIQVRPMLFQDQELTIAHIQSLMSFTSDGSTNPPLYLEVIREILRSIVRNNTKSSVKKFLEDVRKAEFSPGQQSMLDQRINLLKNFSASAAPEIVEHHHPTFKDQALKAKKLEQGVGLPGDCITVEKGTLTVVDLSDPFVDDNTACTLFDICLAVILKRHKEAVKEKKMSPGLIVTLDEAHQYLDKDLRAAKEFTSSLLTVIREQRHNAARVIISTQEPSISAKFLDLCSVSIIHRFTSPAWFAAIREHLGGASSMVNAEEGVERRGSRADLFRRILALNVGESLAFSPTSWVHGGEVSDGGQAVEPQVLGSRVLWMKTRKREGEDAGRTASVV